jgi:VanZ family protein
MTGELQFILMATLGFMALVFYISNRPPKEEPETKQNNRVLATLDLIAEDIQEMKSAKHQKRAPKTNLKSDEIIDTLDWLVAHAIITPEEYTKIMGKCLQFM